MLIIADKGNHSVKYNSRSTRIQLINDEDNDRYRLMINGTEYASSDSITKMKVLYSRLVSFAERYKRLDDTFDIKREIKIIDKELSKGKYTNLTIDHSTIALDIGYPTYTS